AVGGVWPDANGGCRQPAPGVRSGADVGVVHRRVLRVVRCRHRLHSAADTARATRGAGRRAGRRPGGTAHTGPADVGCRPPRRRRRRYAGGPPRDREMNMGIDLTLLWAIIILFGILMYVVMDGFDLGIGILYPFFPDEHDRDVMMNTVAPVWDGNETWLVLGGAGLLAAFPLAYSVVLSAFMLPLIFMLLGLIFRGVAFEFRFKATDRARPFWDKAFIGGSVVATFFQGVTLGAYLEGIDVVGRQFAGGPFDWFRPFPLFTGLGLIVAYAMLGCTWLIMKTDSRLQERMMALARPLALVLLAVIAIISLWTPIA